jgi:hypothetical protein
MEKSIEPMRKALICGAIEGLFFQDFSTGSTVAPSQSQDIAFLRKGHYKKNSAGV